MKRVLQLESRFLFSINCNEQSLLSDQVRWFHPWCESKSRDLSDSAKLLLHLMKFIDWIESILLRKFIHSPPTIFFRIRNDVAVWWGSYRISNPKWKRMKFFQISVVIPVKPFEFTRKMHREPFHRKRILWWKLLIHRLHKLSPDK